MKAAGGDQTLHAPAWMIQPNVLKGVPSFSACVNAGAVAHLEGSPRG